MYYIILEEETPEDWTATYASGAVPEGEEFDVILHSDSRYGVYTVIKTNCPYYWAVGSTLTVRKP
jgi:hypothetical protein